MSTLLIRLAGPMQAWGDASRFSHRRTRSEPTKSGVVGLLAAAEGRRRTDAVEDLAAMRFGVRVDQRGQIERDFQTARSLDGSRVMPLSHRYYLSDATFVAGVEGHRELLTGMAEALQAPVFPLYLGRRAFLPSRPLSIGVVDSELESALRSTPWEASQWYRRRQGRTVHLELALDAPLVADHAGGMETSRDVPVSFDPVRRQHAWRDVVRPSPVAVSNPVGREEPDYLAVHGGF